VLGNRPVRQGVRYAERLEVETPQGLKLWKKSISTSSVGVAEWRYRESVADAQKMPTRERTMLVATAQIATWRLPKLWPQNKRLSASRVPIGIPDWRIALGGSGAGSLHRAMNMLKEQVRNEAIPPLT